MQQEQRPPNNNINTNNELSLPIEEIGQKKAEAETISLVDEQLDMETRVKPTVRQISRSLGPARKSEYKRKLNLTGQGATRCRIFHARIAQEALDNMQTRINEWLDSDEIEVKDIGHVVGTMEGKTPKPNLVITVWY